MVDEASIERAKRLYPPSGYGYSYYADEFEGAYNYEPIVEEIGVVAVERWQEDYQGDTWVLYHDPDSADSRVGYLVFGWGSCSGCDALQACYSWQDLAELIDDIIDSVRWFDDPKQALDWFKEHDHEGDWSWYYEDYKQFVKEATAYLEELVHGSEA